MLDEIRTHAVFPCDKGRKHCIVDLYLPHKEIHPLGLPVLAWPQRIDRDSEDGMYLPDCFLSSSADYAPEQSLTELGFLRHPPLEKLIEIAGSLDTTVQRAAFRYLADKFDELYDTQYDPSNYENMPFIPATKDGQDCVGAYEEVKSHCFFIGNFAAEVENEHQGLF